MVGAGRFELTLSLPDFSLEKSRYSIESMFWRDFTKTHWMQQDERKHPVFVWKSLEFCLDWSV
jgi:hypothetical protein